MSAERRASRQQRLLSLAIACVRGGKLPACKTSEVLAGSGHEEHCSLCNAPISEAEIEYEVSPRDADAPVRSALYFHIRCYEAWAKACRSGTTEGTQESAPARDWRRGHSP